MYDECNRSIDGIMLSTDKAVENSEGFRDLLVPVKHKHYVFVGETRCYG